VGAYMSNSDVEAGYAQDAGYQTPISSLEQGF
jgi:hypothetical protein